MVALGSRGDFPFCFASAAMCGREPEQARIVAKSTQLDHSGANRAFPANSMLTAIEP